MEQVFFVIWRECFEALLVIGIIYAWIKQSPDKVNGMRYLYGGVTLGVVITVMLALVIYGVFSALQGNTQTMFMIAMSVVACVLIVQMVYWMNKNARSMKKTLHEEMNKGFEKHSWWAALFIIAIAIAREGSEIVVFLSGQIMQLNAENYTTFLTGCVIGIVASVLTFFAFILTSRIVSWSKFFKVTGFILLFLALSLLLKAVHDGVMMLVEMNYSIPVFLISPVWDTSNILNGSTTLGDFAVSFFAYREQPMWIEVIVYVVYWVIVVAIFTKAFTFTRKQNAH